MRIAVLFLVLTIAGCTNGTGDGEKQSVTTPVGHGVARIASLQKKLIIAITSDDQRERLSEVVGGMPADFHWIRISVPLTRHDELYGAGLGVNLSDPGAGVEFAQMYRETCNPAKEDFSPCWLYEHYTAGDSGLSGTMILKLTDAQANGSYEISWAGKTDRFGDPVQSYSHTTTAGISVKVIAEVPQ